MVGTSTFQRKSHVLSTLPVCPLVTAVCHFAQILLVHPILPLWSAGYDNNDSRLSPSVSPTHCHCPLRAETAVRSLKI